MCGNCVRQCCAWVCHRSWFHAHRTHLSLLFCFVLYSRITWSTSWFIGLFEPSLSLAFFDLNASFLAFVSGHVLGEFHSSNNFITIHNPFMLLCTHFEFTISSLMHIQQMISWAPCFFLFWIAMKSIVSVLTMPVHFLLAILVLGWKAGFCSSKMTLRLCSFIDQ